MNPAIWLGSALWSSGSWLTRTATNHGFLSMRRLDARVISVGNLQAGGAGKTPLVAQIAREARERGLKFCILSRGYRGRWESQGGIIEPGSTFVNPENCGDEPALLHDLVPEAWIGVGSDRGRQYDRVRERSGSTFDLVILDDGFQHWKIKKDLEVLAVTSLRMGDRIFRDWPEQTARASLVVWTKGDVRPDFRGRPHATVRYRLNVSCDRPIWMVSAVADPNSVSRVAKSSGLILKREIVLPDHARFEKAETENWIREAAAEGCRVAVTGKDWVKWKALGIFFSEVLIIEPEIEFQEGRETWERVLWG